jgi:dUTP pyrophosphatase
VVIVCLELGKNTAAKPMPNVAVPIQVFPHGEGLDLPAYATAGSAGCDLRAAIEAELTITPGGRALVPTGVAVAIPPGYEGQVRMRSGLAHDKGLALLNAPGTVDSDYRGELRIIIANLGAEPVTLHRGDRIAQIVFAPVARAEFERVSELPPTSRGAGGFGSSGKA